MSATIDWENYTPLEVLARRQSIEISRLDAEIERLSVQALRYRECLGAYNDDSLRVGDAIKVLVEVADEREARLKVLQDALEPIPGGYNVIGADMKDMNNALWGEEVES